MALVPLPEINEITSRIIKAAIEVHRIPGPGLFESVYFVCLVHELREAGLTLELQKKIPVLYKGVDLDCGFRVDLIVESKVVRLPGRPPDQFQRARAEGWSDASAELEMSPRVVRGA